MSNATIDDVAENTQAVDAAEETIEVKKEEIIFVNLFKNVFERAGKKLVSYKPWYIKKWSKGEVWTYPVGFWSFHIETGGDYVKNVYDNVFRLTVEVNEKTPEKGELRLTIQWVDSKEYKSFFIKKGVNKEGGIIYKTDAPIEIEGTRYRTTLTKNTKEDKPHLFNLVFKDAGGSDFAGWSEEEIDFWDTPDF